MIRMACSSLIFVTNIIIRYSKRTKLLIALVILFVFMSFYYFGNSLISLFSDFSTSNNDSGNNNNKNGGGDTFSNAFAAFAAQQQKQGNSEASSSNQNYNQYVSIHQPKVPKSFADLIDPSISEREHEIHFLQHLPPRNETYLNSLEADIDENPYLEIQKRQVELFEKLFSIRARDENNFNYLPPSLLSTTQDETLLAMFRYYNKTLRFCQEFIHERCYHPRCYYPLDAQNERIAKGEGGCIPSPYYFPDEYNDLLPSSTLLELRTSKEARDKAFAKNPNGLRNIEAKLKVMNEWSGNKFYIDDLSCEDKRNEREEYFGTKENRKTHPDDPLFQFKKHTSWMFNKWYNWDAGQCTPFASDTAVLSSTRAKGDKAPVTPMNHPPHPNDLKGFHHPVDGLYRLQNVCIRPNGRIFGYKWKLNLTTRGGYERNHDHFSEEIVEPSEKKPMRSSYRGTHDVFQVAPGTIGEVDAMINDVQIFLRKTTDFAKENICYRDGKVMIFPIITRVHNPGHAFMRAVSTARAIELAFPTDPTRKFADFDNDEITHDNYFPNKNVTIAYVQLRTVNDKNMNMRLNKMSYFYDVLSPTWFSFSSQDGTKYNKDMQIPEKRDVYGHEQRDEMDFWNNVIDPLMSIHEQRERIKNNAKYAGERPHSPFVCYKEVVVWGGGYIPENLPGAHRRDYGITGNHGRKSRADVPDMRAIFHLFGPRSAHDIDSQEMMDRRIRACTKLPPRRTRVRRRHPHVLIAARSVYRRLALQPFMTDLLAKELSKMLGPNQFSLEVFEHANSDFRTVVERFSNADIVIGPYGAALCWAGFSPPGAVLQETNTKKFSYATNRGIQKNWESDFGAATWAGRLFHIVFHDELRLARQLFSVHHPHAIDILYGLNLADFVIQKSLCLIQHVKIESKPTKAPKLTATTTMITTSSASTELDGNDAAEEPTSVTHLSKNKKRKPSFLVSPTPPELTPPPVPAECENFGNEHYDMLVAEQLLGLRSSTIRKILLTRRYNPGHIFHSPRIEALLQSTLNLQIFSNAAMRRFMSPRTRDQHYSVLIIEPCAARPFVLAEVSVLHQLMNAIPRGIQGIAVAEYALGRKVCEQYAESLMDKHEMKRRRLRREQREHTSVESEAAAAITTQPKRGSNSKSEMNSQSTSPEPFATITNDEDYDYSPSTTKGSSKQTDEKFASATTFSPPPLPKKDSAEHQPPPPSFVSSRSSSPSFTFDAETILPPLEFGMDKSTWKTAHNVPWSEGGDGNWVEKVLPERLVRFCDYPCGDFELVISDCFVALPFENDRDCMVRGTIRKVDDVHPVLEKIERERRAGQDKSYVPPAPPTTTGGLLPAIPKNPIAAILRAEKVRNVRRRGMDAATPEQIIHYPERPPPTSLIKNSRAKNSSSGGSGQVFVPPVTTHLLGPTTSELFAYSSNKDVGTFISFYNPKMFYSFQPKTPATATVDKKDEAEKDQQLSKKKSNKKISTNHDRSGSSFVFVTKSQNTDKDYSTSMFHYARAMHLETARKLKSKSDREQHGGGAGGGSNHNNNNDDNNKNISTTQSSSFALSSPTTTEMPENRRAEKEYKARTQKVKVTPAPQSEEAKAMKQFVFKHHEHPIVDEEVLGEKATALFVNNLLF